MSSETVRKQKCLKIQSDLTGDCKQFIRERGSTCEAIRTQMVMGYFRPMSQFNDGKQSEFKERKWFTEEKAKEAKECKKLTK